MTKNRKLNGKSRFFNMSIHRDMLMEVKKRALDEGIHPSHYICNCIQDKIGY